MPKVGMSRRVRRNAFGNSLSFAAAIGISPMIRVQPTRQPRPDTTAAIATVWPAHWPPKMALAASVNGAFVSRRAAFGTVPKTVRVPRT